MQHNSADKQFIFQPILVLPMATIAAERVAIVIKLMGIVTTITTAMSSILFELWIVLARFRKIFTNTKRWPSASVWIVR